MVGCAARRQTEAARIGLQEVAYKGQVIRCNGPLSHEQRFAAPVSQRPSARLAECRRDRPGVVGPAAGAEAQRPAGCGGRVLAPNGDAYCWARNGPASLGNHNGGTLTHPSQFARLCWRVLCKVAVRWKRGKVNTWRILHCLFGCRWVLAAYAKDEISFRCRCGITVTYRLSTN